jgi:superfamily II DNA or RNA helicase
MRLVFDRGTLRVEGDGADDLDRLDGFDAADDRLLAYRYRDLRDALDAAGIDYADDVLDPVAAPAIAESPLDLRPYQREALDAWLADRRGAVVLPTGAGKTFVGMAAIAAVGEAALVVVPTLDLVDQWRDELGRFGAAVGEVSGREKRLEPLTVTTYDSAHAAAERLGNRFPTVVFDEVHHLAAEGYSEIAELFASPARLGLTATYERTDDRHARLTDLLGGRVYEIGTDDLAGDHLADYAVERIHVDLTPAERERYDDRVETFRSYLRSSNVDLRGPEDFRKIVIRSGNDPEAWAAVRARNEARRIAYGAERKLDALADLLDRHRDDRVIVFTRHNDLVYDVADRFLVPPVTQETGAEERRDTLRRFREGRYDAVVSSQVLDEGVDVPDANVGVILSGTGSTREFRQRLGRLLRPTGGRAKLYEVVASGTGELRTADRRRADGGWRRGTGRGRAARDGEAPDGPLDGGVPRC